MLVAILQVLDGADGAKAVDDLWPAFHKSEVHATPVTVDFDYDGVMDFLLATNDGELIFIKDTVSCAPTQHPPNCPSDPPVDADERLVYLRPAHSRVMRRCGFVQTEVLACFV
jgi:hypothetical protein